VLPPAHALISVERISGNTRGAWRQSVLRTGGCCCCNLLLKSAGLTLNETRSNEDVIDDLWPTVPDKSINIARSNRFIQHCIRLALPACKHCMSDSWQAKRYCRLAADEKQLIYCVGDRRRTDWLAAKQVRGRPILGRCPSQGSAYDGRLTRSFLD
jgi:hypothetical protein